MKKEFEVVIEVEDIDEVLAQKRDFVVPFAMTLDECEDRAKLYIEVYSDALYLAEQFAEKYENKWFSRKAFDELEACFSRYLKSHGYIEDSYGKYRYYNNYIRQAKLMDSEKALIKSNTKRVGDIDGECINITGLSCDNSDSLPWDSFVTIEDGKIVSVATVNDRGEDSIVAEITVKTAKEYRGLGYGTSNVIALTDHLVSKGVKVGYCCSKNNRGSIALAKKCGFVPTGKMYAVCGWIEG